MSLSLQDLRDELREVTGMDSDDLPDLIADRYLNLSWWDLQDKVKLREREAIVDLSLTPAARSYTLASVDPSLDNVTAVAIRAHTTSDFQTIDKKDYKTILSGLNDQTYAQGVPEAYAVHGTSLYFDPTPNLAYACRITLRKTLADIQAGGPEAPQVWHEFVLLGAAMRIFRRNGEYQKSAAIRLERDALMVITVEQSVKETEDLQFAGVRPMRQTYYRGNRGTR